MSVPRRSPARGLRPRRPRALALIVALVALTGLVACEPPPPVGTNPGDIGWEGPAYTGSSGAPSGSKPESKVWFHDGRWWGDLWDTTTSDHYIHWYDVSGRRWVRTGTILEDRSGTRSDVLSDGNALYVSSHRFAEGSGSTATGQPALLRRYSYNPASKTYSLDAGFPVQINDARSETLVIDKDSTGRLWATWTQNAKVMVSVSSVGGQVWGTPFVVPTGDATVDSDDISSLVAFSPGRIGVMWSNQEDDTFYFAHRSDSDPAGTWSPAEVAYTGPSHADDHINLANVSNEGGRILAAVKTSRTGSNPLNVLLDRNPSNGVWEAHTYGLSSDAHTRPIVVADQEHGVARMFAPASQSGGSVYEKTAPLDDLGFVPGRGNAVLTDATSNDINNPTSTKQPVDATTGLLVLATNDSTRQYWTHFDPLDGPPDPEAWFTAARRTGGATLEVVFTDDSNGSSQNKLWSLGDGTYTSGPQVIHRFSQPGTYEVNLWVSGPGPVSHVKRMVTVTSSGGVTVQ